jgi:hypothetical protein
MDTVSLLVYHRVHAAGPWILLVGLVSLGLVLLGVAGLGLDVPLPQPPGDPLLAPFRWQPASANIA